MIYFLTQPSIFHNSMILLYDLGRRHAPRINKLTRVERNAKKSGFLDSSWKDFLKIWWSYVINNLKTNEYRQLTKTGRDFIFFRPSYSIRRNLLFNSRYQSQSELLFFFFKEFTFPMSMQISPQ